MNNELPTVSKETAILLKDAGFDLYCQHRYRYDDELKTFYCDGAISKSAPLSEKEYFAPTQALAQMWIEKVAKIYIYIYAIHKSWDALTDFNLGVNVHPINEKYFLYMGHRKPIKTYEEALEVGIQKACEYKKRKND